MLPGLPNNDPSGYAGFDEEESKRPEDKKDKDTGNKGLLGKTAGMIGSGFSSIKGGASNLASKVGNLRG